MGIKDFFAKTGNWIKSSGIANAPDDTARLDELGLIAEPADESPQQVEEDVVATATVEPDGPARKPDSVRVQPLHPTERREPIEKLQEGFDHLIVQLKGINENLNRQIDQQQQIMQRVEKIPDLLETFPQAVENQHKLSEQLVNHLQTAAARNDQFIDAVERIPNETAKQTDALVNIDHQLAAAADMDVQMSDSFNNFKNTIEKLNTSTTSQTDSITQMSRTFAASDRYLKYILSRQNRRFMWIFIAAIATCLVAIFVLAGIIIYIKA